MLIVRRLLQVEISLKQIKILNGVPSHQLLITLFKNMPNLKER